MLTTAAGAADTSYNIIRPAVRQAHGTCTFEVTARETWDICVVTDGVGQRLRGSSYETALTSRPAKTVSKKRRNKDGRTITDGAIQSAK